MNLDITLADAFEMRRDLAMKSVQRMERNRGGEVMLGMERHVPVEQPQDWVGQRRPRIREQVRTLFGTCMFGHANGAQHRLSHDARQKPVHERDRATEVDANNSYCQIQQAEQPDLEHDRAE